MLLDALAAMELLNKQDARYAICPGVADALTSAGGHSVLARSLYMALDSFPKR
jgi:hypothetical protein